MAGVSAGRVVSVNVATPVDAPWAGRPGRTAIHKRPVDGPVRVHELGLEGDQVANTKHHGGPFQAVYAFAQEDLDTWSERLGEPVRPGVFGENLTTTGLDVNEAVLGEVWRIGTAVLSPCEIRIPCNTFKAWLGREGFDSTGWLKRFAADNRPGPYLRVLEPGVLQAGDEIRVEDRPGTASRWPPCSGRSRGSRSCGRCCSTYPACPTRCTTRRGHSRPEPPTRHELPDTPVNLPSRCRVGG